MKISGTVEQIFAHAVALDQSGGLRNTIYAIGNEVFILNYDHTVLLRFRLRASEIPFENPISFRANDYDSNEFYEEDGKIVFVSNQGGYQRKKSCGTPDFTPKDIQQVFNKYEKEKLEAVVVQLPKDIIGLLDRELSHIEFVGKAGDSLTLIQRNIYSGAIIEVKGKKRKSGFFDTLKLEKDIEPIAIKTNDFVALFAFQDVLKFHLPVKGKADYMMVESIDSKKRDMKGFIAGCLYDEIIEIKEAEIYGGRKKPKDRGSK